MSHRVIFLLLLPLMAVPADTRGESPAESCGERREVLNRALDEFTWNQLNRVYDKVGDSEFEEARDDLLKMLDRAGEREVYLQAVLNQALAQVAWSREDYASALRHFERAEQLDALPDPAHFALVYQLAQLYYLQDRDDEALQNLESWFCAVPEDQETAHAWVLKAMILSRQGNFAAALPAIETAIRMEDEPNENWYRLKLSAQFELEQSEPAAATLEAMIIHWPDRKTYWTQLAQIHHALGQGERALAVLSLAHRNGLLDHATDLSFLSGLYRNQDLPYRAAEVLETGIRAGVVDASREHWLAAADAWYAAEELERALAAYDAAGRSAENGRTDLRRGYILVDLERWGDALGALDRALGKGGMDERETGEAYLLRGMSHFNLGRLDAAAADWAHAERSEETQKAAAQWLNHLREERRRQNS